MASLNKVQLIGNVGKNPEARYTPSGKMVSSFSLAVNSSWTSNGEKKQATDWFNIEVWGKLAEVIQEHVSKGSSLYVEGRLKIETSGEGENRKFFTKIIAQSVQFLGGKNGGSGSSGSHVEEPIEIPDDSDIPF